MCPLNLCRYDTIRIRYDKRLRAGSVAYGCHDDRVRSGSALCRHCMVLRRVFDIPQRVRIDPSRHNVFSPGRPRSNINSARDTGAVCLSGRRCLHQSIPWCTARASLMVNKIQTLVGEGRRLLLLRLRLLLALNPLLVITSLYHAPGSLLTRRPNWTARATFRESVLTLIAAQQKRDDKNGRMTESTITNSKLLKWRRGDPRNFTCRYIHWVRKTGHQSFVHCPHLWHSVLNIDRLAKLFRWHTPQKICGESVIKVLIE